jgi:Flp pilus assembly protein CpaB
VGAGRGNGVAAPRRRALASRVSTGHVVMVLAGVLGVLLTLSVLRAADDTRPMLAAARDIAPGTVIDGNSFRVTRVHVDDDVLATLFDESALHGLRGRVAVEHITLGALVTRDEVRGADSGDGPRAMSFPIPRSRAVGGALVTGDRVDVLSVVRNSGRSGYVAVDVQVLAFSSRGSGPLQGSDDASITIAVGSDAAARIAAALETGTITLVRATGATPLRQAAPFDPAAEPAATTAATPVAGKS